MKTCAGWDAGVADWLGMAWHGDLHADQPSQPVAGGQRLGTDEALWPRHQQSLIDMYLPVDSCMHISNIQNIDMPVESCMHIGNIRNIDMPVESCMHISNIRNIDMPVVSCMRQPHQPLARGK
jgi:hypothetical protein